MLRWWIHFRHLANAFLYLEGQPRCVVLWRRKVALSLNLFLQVPNWQTKGKTYANTRSYYFIALYNWMTSILIWIKNILLMKGNYKGNITYIWQRSFEVLNTFKYSLESTIFFQHPSSSLWLFLFDIEHREISYVLLLFWHCLFKFCKK
jgi:hypothetical protein